MEKSIIDQKRKKLQSEIQFAQHRLSHNINNLLPYEVQLASDVQLPKLITLLTHDPKKTIEITSHVARLLFPQNEPIDHISKGLKLWTSITEPSQRHN